MQILQNLDSATIEKAARLLLEGRLVAFPTETVYGLGANALNADAVALIYAVKGRPSNSPLIVHVDSVEMAKSLAQLWPDAAELLARRFWPGPLTLVLPKRDVIPAIVSAGLPTIGLRMPSHPIALALIRAAGVPLAAPSANRFTQLSPTRAEHVQQALGEHVAMVLDGGASEVGIESTVLSLVGPRPVLLRPGGVTRKQIEEEIGPIDLPSEDISGAHPSPGMHPRHYSPRTRLVLVSGGRVPEIGGGVYLRVSSPCAREDVKTVPMPAVASDYAAILYEKLHEADRGHYDWIAVDTPPATPDWEAVHDRLRRAANGS